MDEPASRVAVEQKITKAEKQPDVGEPSAERRAELHAAYEANRASGKAPYTGVHIWTLGEILWIQREREWSTALGTPEERRVNLSGADLYAAILSGAKLCGAILSDTVLMMTNLNSADLSYATLSSANLVGAKLTGADLTEATLNGASLMVTTLCGANLFGATLSGADLSRATLCGANLREVHMDDKTDLADVILDNKTRFEGVYWGAVALTRVDWRQARRLGDEDSIKAAKTRRDRITASQQAARAYRGLAIALRAQGLLSFASGYRLREQRLERKAAWYGRHYGEWLFSALLDLVAGYGEALGRILISYMVVVGGFAAAYWGVTHFLETKLSKLAWNEALVLSLTSFHGRGFFPGSLPLGDIVSEVAALEAVIGLFIELILIATFSRRFLGN